MTGVSRPSSAKPRPAKSTKPSASAPATWTMRKFHVSMGKRGRNGRSTPVRRSIDTP